MKNRYFFHEQNGFFSTKQSTVFYKIIDFIEKKSNRVPTLMPQPTSHAKLKKRTGEFNVDRKRFLEHLCVEFRTSDSSDAREQILANLANFAYDPINYTFIRELNIVELFVSCLDSANERFVLFSSAGICNVCLDPECAKIIVKTGAISKLRTKILEKTHEDVTLNALTTLIYVVNASNRETFITTDLIERVRSFQTNTTNQRLSNLSQTFLFELCTSDQTASRKRKLP